jgi:hypothetical protein
MSTRAEEIAAEGPYKVIQLTDRLVPTFVLTGPHHVAAFWATRHDAKTEADRLNAAYNHGQQDRWISVEEQFPEPNIEMLVAFANDTVAGTSQWCRVRPPNIMGWLGPVENNGKTITHWMPLPPSPTNPEQR